MNGGGRRRARHGPLLRAAAIAALLAPLGCAAALESAPPGAATPAAPASAPTGPGRAALVTPEFAAVVVHPGDTLESLAAKWFRDAWRAWEIAEFNGVAEAVPGAELAIPLRPFRRGGLTAQGYQTVPVLSYHHFADRSTDRTTVTGAAFEAQMLYLKERGYRPVTLDRLFDFMEFRGQLPEKAVVITVDDGWRSAYDIAFPVLRRLGFPATLFVSTDLVGGDNRSLTWEQLREMAAAGLEVQSHTVTHRDLTVQKDGESLEQYLDAVEREIAESARVLEQRLGRRPRYLAYPFGATNSTVVALLRKNGYRGAFTVTRDGNPFFLSPYRLSRAMVGGDFDLAKFERNLAVTDRRALK